MAHKGFYKIVCDKCNCNISNNNFKIHFEKCNRNPSSYIRKRNNLPICLSNKKTLSNNKNINWEEIQEYYNENHTYRDIQKKYKITSSAIAKAVKQGLLKTRTASESIALRGSLKTPKMTLEMREKISKGMRKAVLEGRQKTLSPYGSRIKIFHHISWLNNEEILHGNWERKVAEFMDNSKINWTKSKKSFTYIFESGEHEYFPDFYLLDYNLYIEVKGQITCKDLEKWKQFPEKLLILDKYNINKLNDFFYSNNLLV